MAKRGTASKKTKNIKAQPKSSTSITLMSVYEEREKHYTGRTKEGLKISLPIQYFKATNQKGQSTFKPTVSTKNIAILVYDEQNHPFEIGYDFFLANRGIGAATAAGIQWVSDALEVTAIGAALGPFVPIATVGSFLFAAYTFFTKEADNRKNAERIISGVVKQVKLIVDQLDADLKSYIDDSLLRDLQGKLAGAGEVLGDIVNDWESTDPEVRNLSKTRLAQLSDTLTIFVIGPLKQMADGIESNLNLAARSTPFLYSALLLKEHILQYFNNGGRSIEIVAKNAGEVLKNIDPLLVEIRKISDKQFFERYDSVQEPGGPTEYYCYYRGNPRLLVTTTSINPAQALQNEKNAEFPKFAEKLLNFKETQAKSLQEAIENSK